MVIVNKAQVSLQGNKLVSEASSMGLRPGDWPYFIGVVDNSGAGFMFERSTEIIHNGEFGGYNYRTRAGAHLIVFND
jgi:hypothetical protein